MSISHYISAGTLDVLLKHDPDFAKDAGLQIHTLGDEHVAFAANLYSQPAHFIVRRGAGIQCPGDLVDKTVSLGLKRSGGLFHGFGTTRSFQSKWKNSHSKP